MQGTRRIEDKYCVCGLMYGVARATAMFDVGLATPMVNYQKTVHQH